MAAQPFISDMQTLNTGCIQQTNSAAQQQKQNPGSKTQQSQGTVAPQVAVVAHTGSQQSQQQQQQQPVQTSPGVPQFIAVEQDSQSPGNVNLQQQSGVHHAYVHYVDGSADPGLYAATNGQMAGYSVYSVTDSGTMYTPSSATYYNTGSGTAVSYSQVGSNVNQGVGIQGQILTHQGSGTYLVQGSPLDGEGHPLAHASRASPATIHIMEENGAYKVQGTLMDGESHHNLTSASSATSHATRISPVTEDPRKVTDILSSYSNDQCVIQTLHSSHDNSQLQALPSQQPQQQQQQPPQSSHHSQHQNVRDMDIIHVQWLIDNYETAEGVSLPRSTLYNHYLRHCTEHKLEPVNAASFGKLIRSVFLGLRTRRLGTRGNSKYHYYGIRVKPSSPLNQLAEDVSTTALRQQPVNQTKRFKPSVPTKAEVHDGNSNASSTTGSQTAETTHSTIQPTPQQQQHQQYLGDATAAIPAFIKIDFDGTPLPDGVTEKEVEAFRLLYREHCEAFLEAVMNLQFSMVENLWETFWRGHNNHGDPDKHLGKSKLQLLCKCQPVIRFVRRADYQFYQNLVDVLIPDVLRPIPSSLTQAIRNFAKSLEGWLTSAMLGCPDDMVKIKVSAVSAFAQTLRRYTSLNHLAQAARAVLQNSSQINQMLADLNRVDFHNVQEQASWVCQCEDDMVQRLEQDFKLTLQQQNSLEQWAAWLEGVVSMVLLPHEGKPDFPKAARQFLLKWSFYSSMVIRDLTLRSAASFGSFHLIRLLYDEYMFYLIEHRVAKATGETPIAVMGEFIGMGSRLYCGGGKDSERLAATLSSASRNVIENGSPEDSCTGLLGSQSSFAVTVANGLKDSATLTSLQRGLIGQPAVCIGTGATDAVGTEPLLQQNKKVKSV